MEMALTFNSVQLAPVSHNNQPWIRSAELARALAYSDERKISHLYSRHSDEFSSDMSVVLNLGTTAHPNMTRIFSLRGCHLLAMFARTPVAKEFRKWVLNVLDKLAEQEWARLATEVKEIPDSSRLSKRTDPERKQLTAILNTWVGMAPIHYANARAQVNAHFGVTGVDKLTVAQVRKAIQWIQGKIDAIPPQALPPAPDATPEQSRLPIFRNGCFYPPHKNSKHVAGPREKALRDFWNNEAGKREQELRAKFREFLECIDKAAGDHLCAHAVSALDRDADTMFSVSCMQEGMYCARDMGEAA